MEDLITRAEKLQAEARQQIEELKLTELLSPFGNVIVVGSVVTGLMTWPDIDIEVIVAGMPSKEEIGGLGKTLFLQNDMVRVWLMDNRKKIDPHQPKGIYLGGKRMVGEVIWKFDIWFLREEDQRSGKDDLRWVSEALTPATKEAILRIKDKVAENPKYRKSIFSIDIYQAVLKEGITDVEGFDEYLKKTERTLGNI